VQSIAHQMGSKLDVGAFFFRFPNLGDQGRRRDTKN
jgi:hypothetical protein